jgi:hypothetical protein
MPIILGSYRSCHYSIHFAAFLPCVLWFCTYRFNFNVSKKGISILANIDNTAIISSFIRIHLGVIAWWWPLRLKHIAICDKILYQIYKNCVKGCVRWYIYIYTACVCVYVYVCIYVCILTYSNTAWPPHILHTLLAAVVHLAEGWSFSLLKLKVEYCLVCLAGTQMYRVPTWPSTQQSMSK